MKYYLIILFTSLGIICHAQEIIDLVDCEDNCLWTVSDNKIQSWNINNALPRMHSGGADNSHNSFAIGHVHVSSDTILNTFISADWVLSGEGERMKYWDGKVWVEFMDAPSGRIQGLGSYENHLYIKSQTTQSSMIHYYDGETLTEVDLPFNEFGIADIAVDASGNAWYPSMTTVGSESLIDSLFIFSGDQSIYRKYPLAETISGTGSYGAAIVNDTLYVGFQETNPTYPNKVISLVIEDDEVKIADKVVSFESGFSDLASKYPSSLPLDTIRIPSSCKIYPNPFVDYLFVERPEAAASQVIIYSTIGEFVYQEKLEGITTQLDLKFLTPGTYYLQIDEETKKIIRVD